MAAGRGRRGRTGLVVLGRQGIWSPEQMDQLHAVGNDRLDVRVVEDAGHCVRRDRPDAFHALVDPWITAQLDRP